MLSILYRVHYYELLKGPLRSILKIYKGSPRFSHCRQCKQHINTNNNLICPQCNWIICGCGVCAISCYSKKELNEKKSYFNEYSFTVSEEAPEEDPEILENHFAEEDEYFNNPEFLDSMQEYIETKTDK